MSPHLRSELIKQRTVPTGRTLGLALLALVLFAVLLHSLSLPAAAIDSRPEQLTIVFAWGEAFGALFGGLLGALSVTAEFRHGTIRPTFLVTPRRGRVLAAKTICSMAIAAAFGLLATTIAVGVGLTSLEPRGIDVLLGGADYALVLAGGAVASALWAAIGVGLGALVRHQVAVIAGISIWLLFIENLLVSVVPEAGRLAPGAAGAALGGINPDDLLAPAAGAALLAAYAAVVAALGWLAIGRRDAA